MAENSEIVNKLRDRYLHSVQSRQYQKWRTDASLAYDFYDGDQIDSSTKRELDERGQPGIVINMIANKVDALLDTELENRTVTAFRERTFDQTDREIAKALSAVSMQIQEVDDTALKNSDVFKNGLISGIGWLQVTQEDGRISTNSISPFEVVWDVDDSSPQLTNQKYVFRHYWIDIDEAKQTFPGKEKEINDLVGQAKDGDTSTVPFPDLQQQTTTSDTFALSADDREPFQFIDKKRNKILIVEGQYKVPTKKYRFFTEDGRQKEVYDEDVAKEQAASEVVELEGMRTMIGIFSSGVLLYHAPSQVVTQDFEYIPYVFKRENRTGAPYGIVKAAIDPQREFNKRRSKMLHLLNTRGVIVDADAVEDPEKARREIARPDFWLEVRPGAKIDFQDNLQLADGQRAVMERAAQDIEKTMGVFDEVEGQQTNATSGVAIGRRQIASLKTKSFSLDAFQRFKKRFGRALLAHLQSITTENYMVSMFGESEMEGQITLNKPYKYKGKTVFENDIQTAQFDVVIEDVPAFDAPPEQLAETLRNVAMNGFLPMVLQSKTLAKAFGLKYIDQIQRELAQSAPSQPQADGAAASQEANPTPSPSPQ